MSRRGIDESKAVAQACYPAYRKIEQSTLLLQVAYALTLSPMAWGYAAEAGLLRPDHGYEHYRHQYLAVNLALGLFVPPGVRNVT